MSFEHPRDGHQLLDVPAPLPDRVPPGFDLAAFRELHGRRLYGFALLLSLGDRDLAGMWAADAIAAAHASRAELRHPERAAAWLRARVVAAASRRPDPPTTVATDRADSLEDLHVDAPLLSALSTISIRQRAALLANDVEKFDSRDVAIIVGARGRRLGRMLTRARARFIGGFTADAPTEKSRSGPITKQIRDIAERVMQ